MEGADWWHVRFLFSRKTKVTGIIFDRSIKQGGKESPSLFIMMKSIFVMLQDRWRRNGNGVGQKVSQGGKGLRGR